MLLEYATVWTTTVEIDSASILVTPFLSIVRARSHYAIASLKCSRTSREEEEEHEEVPGTMVQQRARRPGLPALLAMTFFAAAVITLRNLKQVAFVGQVNDAIDEPNNSELARSNPEGSKTIAYAVTVTSCKKKQLVMDGAAVLQHSIHLNSIRTMSSGSKYDYNMVAFVHPDGEDCMEILQLLNYTVMTKSVPFSLQQIRGNYRRWANRTGCCGEKEWLKLYSYTLVQYPVVIHLDLDCLILKPLDDLIDSMIDPELPRDRIPAMWVNTTGLPKQIDAFFTRDYGMIQIPGRRAPHQIGVQGGFLVVRPDQSVFDEYIEIILEGNYTESSGWGGSQLKYGGYYGAGTIQGLAAMYYSHLHPENAVELNRCYYNNMVDCPYPKKYDEPENQHIKQRLCISLQETCEDCRKTPINDIFSIHLTNCFKPWHCVYNGRAGKTSFAPNPCVQHHYEWYRIRYLLEAKWKGIEANTTRIEDAHRFPLKNLSFGFCEGPGPQKYTAISPELLPH